MRFRLYSWESRALLNRAWLLGQRGVGSSSAARVTQQPGSRGTRGKQRAGNTVRLLVSLCTLAEPHPLKSHGSHPEDHFTAFEDLGLNEGPI